jgi:hypothetical protein
VVHLSCVGILAQVVVDPGPDADVREATGFIVELLSLEGRTMGSRGPDKADRGLANMTGSVGSDFMASVVHPGLHPVGGTGSRHRRGAVAWVMAPLPLP